MNFLFLFKWDIYQSNLYFNDRLTFRNCVFFCFHIPFKIHANLYVQVIVTFLRVMLSILDDRKVAHKWDWFLSYSSFIIIFFLNNQKQRLYAGISIIETPDPHTCMHTRSTPRSTSSKWNIGSYFQRLEKNLIGIN